MPSSEPLLPSKPAGLLPGQIPWGVSKPVAGLLPKQVPWATSKTASASPPPKAIPTGPLAKNVPWGSAKIAAPHPVPKKNAPVLLASTTPWALPKPASPNPGQPPAAASRPTPARPPSKPGPAVPHESSAEELVALLSRRSARTRKERTVQKNYRARPIDFNATRWEALKMRMRAQWLRLTLAGTGLLLVLGLAYFLRLVSLGIALDRQWQATESILRQRSALVPAYAACIAGYSSEERHTLALAEKALASWRTARTDREIVFAAARMERTLLLLAKVMTRYDRNGVAREPAQIESSRQFARLEERREQSAAQLNESARSYNQAVEAFNDKVRGIPGIWFAAAAHLPARLPLHTE